MTGRFDNWPPRVEYTEREHVHSIDAGTGQVQPASDTKKKKPKKTTKKRLPGGRR